MLPVHTPRTYKQPDYYGLVGGIYRGLIAAFVTADCCAAVFVPEEKAAL